MDQQATAEYSAAAARVFAGDDSPRDNPLFGLGVDLLSEFELAKQHRVEAENRWLMDLRQYKGQYEPELDAKLTTGGRSKSFLRKTRVKVESVDARLMDLLFPANRERNYAVDSTPEPSLPDALKQTIIASLVKATGQQPDDTLTRKAIKEYADAAAQKMETRIDDQLTEARYRDVSRNVLHSGNLYGTGILKGPLVERRSRLSYVWQGGKFVQQRTSFAAPFITHVPLWRWYPDMTVTELKDCRYTWEHHRLSRADLAELASRKSFDGETIKRHIDNCPDGGIKLMNYEQTLRGMGEQARISNLHKTGQYDVYERWGYLTAEVLSACGVDVPQERMHESFFSNLWLLPDGEVIKAVLAPIEGVEWPYQLYYFDKDETSIFGEGLPSIMRDDQEMINAAVRMMLDNAAVTAGPQFEVFVPAFPEQADLTSIYPGKVWPRIGGDFQYPAVRSLQFDAHIGELIQLVQLFDTNADETTAIPKFTYGDNPQNGAAATMGGLSMLMAQANIALKDLVVNFDEGITKPFISALYHWNMKFSKDDSIKGDFDVSAKGASSLVAKEVRSQTLAQFGATLQPEERAYIKWDELVRQKADVQDLTDITKTKEEVDEEGQGQAAQMAQQMAQMQQQLQMALLQGQVAKLAAEAEKSKSEAMNRRIEAVYAAMEAAGIAATNATIAPAGDAILRSAGWQDADQAPGSGADQAQPVDPAEQAQAAAPDMPQADNTHPNMPGQPPSAEPPMPADPGMAAPDSPHDGQRAGIETPGVQQ